MAVAMVTAKMCASFEFSTGQRVIIWKKYLLVILEQKTAMRISCHGNQGMMRSCLFFKIS
jgi:hypothetical protein